MPIVISLLYLCLYLLVLGLGFVLVTWVLGLIGIDLPENGRRILMAIFAIIAIILILKWIVVTVGIGFPGF